MNYMVIAKVNGTDYLTKVEADTLYDAEHVILDEAVTTRFGYGVDGAQAFCWQEMQTECFASMVLHAEPIGYGHLVEIIQDRNNKLKHMCKAFERAEEIKKKVRALEEELQEAKAAYEAAIEAYNNPT